MQNRESCFSCETTHDNINIILIELNLQANGYINYLVNEWVQQSTQLDNSEKEGMLRLF